MASSHFLLQIVRRGTPDAAGEFQPVQFEPGLSVEINFVDACVQATLKRGVGLGRTSAHVERDMRDAIEEVILGLKQQIQPT